MRINKDGICENDREIAVQILNSLRAGQKVFGNPARGLEITLSELENKRDSKVYTKLEWALTDKELNENIEKLHAGIKGERELSEHLSQLLKYNDDLDGIIAFASLSQEQENNDLDYIPDSDFLIVRNDNFLIIDAKNVSTNPNVPIHLVGNDILTDSDKPKTVLEGVHSSVKVWQNYFDKMGIKYNSIKNIVCIVNKKGAYITPPEATDMELIHIVDLNKYLTYWYEFDSGNDYVRLYDLVQLAKCQIRKEKSELNLTNMRRLFGV